MSILSTKNLSFTYPKAGSVHHATIEDVSFSIEKGQTLGIIGHTGSGKSTLLQTLNGLIKPDSGIVFLDDADLWEDSGSIYQKRFRVGLVFQYPEYQLFEETVFKDIAYGPKNMGLDEAEINRRVLEYSRLLGISKENLEKSPFDLSGGEKRRVALAGILAMEPDVLVLDEPTAGLDPKGRQMLFDAVKAYKKSKDAAVIIVSHSMEDLSKLCDRLLVLSGGRIELLGSVDEVFSNVEKLNSMGLDVPMVTGILLELKRLGIEVDTNAYTVKTAGDVILKLIKRGDGNE